MTRASTTRRPQAPTGPPTDRAQTHASRQQVSEPRLPHERDQSADSQTAGTPEKTDTVGEQAYADAASGAIDTDRGPVMDTLYRRTLKTRVTDSSAPAAATKPPRRR